MFGWGGQQPQDTKIRVYFLRVAFGCPMALWYFRNALELGLRGCHHRLRVDGWWRLMGRRGSSPIEADWQSLYHCWLVLWNMNFMTFHRLECHHSNWWTHILQRGRWLNHQPDYHGIHMVSGQKKFVKSQFWEREIAMLSARPQSHRRWKKTVGNSPGGYAIRISYPAW